MASSPELVKFLADQLKDAGTIVYRKMFEEYGLYCDGKYFACVSDDQLFIKITEAGRRVWPGLKEAPPYEGARNCFLIKELENREMLTKLAVATLSELPEPGQKKKRRKEDGI